MANLDPEALVKVRLEQVRSEVGSATFEAAFKMYTILQDYLENGEKFTGKVVFTVNCRGGGVGTVEAHVQKKID